MRLLRALRRSTRARGRTRPSHHASPPSRARGVCIGTERGVRSTLHLILTVPALLFPSRHIASHLASHASHHSRSRPCTHSTRSTDAGERPRAVRVATHGHARARASLTQPRRRSAWPRAATSPRSWPAAAWCHPIVGNPPPLSATPTPSRRCPRPRRQCGARPQRPPPRGAPPPALRMGAAGCRRLPHRLPQLAAARCRPPEDTPPPHRSR